MVRPVNNFALQNINNPYGNTLAQLSNTFANLGQQRQQRGLRDLQESQLKQQLSQQTAPQALEIFKQARLMPLEQRQDYIQQNAEVLGRAGIDLTKAVPEDFSDQGLDRGIQMFGSMIPRQSTKLVEIGDPTSPTGSRFVSQRDALGQPGRERKPLVSLGGEQEKAENKEYGKYLVQNFGKIDERAVAAQDNLQQLQIAKNIDVRTGAIEPLKAWGSAITEGLGLDPKQFGLDKATNAQSFNAIMGNVLATKLAAQKGPQTDKDAERMKETLASLGNTPEARDFLLNSSIALEERAVEQRDFYSNWRDTKGSFDGAERAWRAYIAKTPLFGKNPNSGRPVFFNEFKQAMIQANPDATEQQILDIWRKKYRGW